MATDTGWEELKNEYYRIKFKLLEYLWDMRKKNKNLVWKVKTATKSAIKIFYSSMKPLESPLSLGHILLQFMKIPA